MTLLDSRQRPHTTLDGQTSSGSVGEPSTVNLNGFLELRVWAESFWDAQTYRTELFNRLGLKANGTPTKTGSNVDLETAGLLVAPVLAHEQHLKKMLLRTYRRVTPPAVIEWQKTNFGIGDHLLARLLGQLGHPRIATPYHWEGPAGKRVLVADPSYERSLRQLYAYCGVGAPERRRKGMSQEEALALGNPRCKTLLWLISKQTTLCRLAPRRCSEAKPEAVEPAIFADQPIDPPTARTAAAGQPLLPHPPARCATAKAEPAGEVPLLETPIPKSSAREDTASRQYRLLYEQRRAHTATTHPEWTDGHAYADALRIVSKAILRDLWTAAQ